MANSVKALKKYKRTLVLYLIIQKTLKIILNIINSSLSHMRIKI
jgi:hypothetical protein